MIDYNMDKAKTEFLQMVSHELRTPISPIIAYIDLMMDGAAKKGDICLPKEVVQEMHLCAEKAKMVVNELIEAASLQMGAFPLESEDVDLCEALNLAVDLNRAYAMEHKVKLKGISNRAPIRFNGDRKGLHEIFYHLISNAIKFTPEGGKVDVSASEKGDNIEVAISDNGIGIPVGKRRLIFKAFHQSDSSSARRYEGVGLGLYLVKKLVELHKGKIKVKSNDGIGTSFIVSFSKASSSKHAPRSMKTAGFSSST